MLDNNRHRFMFGIYDSKYQLVFQIGNSAWCSHHQADAIVRFFEAILKLRHGWYVAYDHEPKAVSKPKGPFWGLS
jgi:hypothetical protein